MKHEPEAMKCSAEFERMELAYCERCGALRVRPAEDMHKFCGVCAAGLQWIGLEAHR